MESLRKDIHTNRFYKNLSWNNSLTSFHQNSIKIKELTSGKELWEEGDVMKNCSYLYGIRNILDGYQILSCSKNGKKILTLESTFFKTNQVISFKVLQARKVGNKLANLSSNKFSFLQIFEQRIHRLLKTSRDLPKVKATLKDINSSGILDEITLSADLHGGSYTKFLYNFFKKLKLNVGKRQLSHYADIILEHFS